MENTKIPKNRYNGRRDTEDHRKRQIAGKAECKPEDALTKIEAEMEKSAADIALTVSDMFKFMAMSAAMLPNMELDTCLFRLKVDDDGIFFEINHPFCKDKQFDTYEDGAEKPDNDYDEDEEGLIYDGD